MNILAYATFDRPLPDRLTATTMPLTMPPFQTVSVARLRHGGDWWSGLDGLKHLSERIAGRIGVGIDEQDAVTAEQARQSHAQVIWLTGHTFEPPSAAGRVELKSFVAGGGMLLASACCGDPAFHETFQSWAMELFGPDRWEQIPQDDPLLTGSFAPGLASSLHGLSYRRSFDGGEPAHLDWPILYGIRHRDRWVVVYSAYDISCGINRHPCVNAVGYMPIDADALVTNVLLYALTRGEGPIRFPSAPAEGEPSTPPAAAPLQSTPPRPYPAPPGPGAEQAG